MRWRDTGVLVKRVCVAMSLLALVFVVSACGGASKESPIASKAAVGGGGGSTTSSQALPQGQTVKSDGDADNPKDTDGNPDPDTDRDDDSYTAESRRYPDADDKVTLAYGESPVAAERRKIANVVTRYYAAAAVGDGTAACALILPSLAKSVPEDYGAATSGLAYLRGGKTCAAVVTALFRHDHAQLSVAPKVLSVRAKGALAQVVVGSLTIPASLIYLQRQGAGWYLESLLGAPLP